MKTRYFYSLLDPTKTHTAKYSFSLYTPVNGFYAPVFVTLRCSSAGPKPALRAAHSWDKMLDSAGTCQQFTQNLEEWARNSPLYVFKTIHQVIANSEQVIPTSQIECVSPRAPCLFYSVKDLPEDTCILSSSEHSWIPIDFSPYWVCSDTHCASEVTRSR